MTNSLTNSLQHAAQILAVVKGTNVGSIDNTIVAKLTEVEKNHELLKKKREEENIQYTQNLNCGKHVLFALGCYNILPQSVNEKRKKEDEEYQTQQAILTTQLMSRV